LVFQNALGATPVIRVNVYRGANPDPAHTHDWLFFRGPSAGFSPEVDSRNYLVGTVKGGHLQYFEDDTATAFDLEFADTFTFTDTGGTQGTATVNVTYNHYGLVAGNTYFYRAQRIVDPWRPQVPTATQVTEPVTPTFTFDPIDILGDASEAAGPVTYSLPAVLSSPVGVGTPVSPTGATFTWTPQIGADEYQVQVYADSLLSQLVTSSPIITWTGQTALSWTFNDFTFSGDTTYFWVVGSRTAGEVHPGCQVGGKTVPFVLSQKANFRTVTLPPPPVTSSAGSGRPRNVPGWWGEHRPPR
jgi:hypothetical protein